MPSAPPLSDRTLKYGRNVMATSGVIVVLAWVPGIEIDRFKPFGFDFSDGGALAFWCVLFVVMFYYFISFVIGAAINIHLWMSDPGGLKVKWAEGADKKPIIGAGFVRAVSLRDVRFTNWRMWFDVGTPTVMLIAAMVAAVPRIVDLWP